MKAAKPFSTLPCGEICNASRVAHGPIASVVVRNLRLQELGFWNFGFRRLKRGLRVCTGVCWVAKWGHSGLVPRVCIVASRQEAGLPYQDNPSRPMVPQNKKIYGVCHKLRGGPI